MNNYFKLLINLYKSPIRPTNIRWFNSIIATRQQHYNHQICTKFHSHKSKQTKLYLLPMGFLSIFKKDEETPEDKMINTIKRSIILMQNEEFNKAEKMLHLALRMAQDLQSRDGITYIYDVMANLATESGQYVKSNNLFIKVMQRLIQDGYKVNHVKMLHISGKIAHNEFLQGNIEKAKIGFEWTLKQIEENLKHDKDDPNLKELWGLVKDQFAHLLIQEGNYNEAKKHFTEAYDIFVEIHGKNNPEAVNLLNNLAVVCINTKDITSADAYLSEAVLISKNFPELEDSGIYKANQGLLLIQKGMLDEANKTCKEAWRSAKKVNNKNGVEQADYCLKQVKAAMDDNNGNK